MKKIIVTALICMATILCTCASGFAEVTSEDVLNAFQSENPPENIMAEILDYEEIQEDKIIDTRLIHKWYILSDKPLLRDTEAQLNEMESNFIGTLNEMDFQIMYIVPTMENEKVKEFLFEFSEKENGSVTILNAGEVKGFYWGMPYPLDEFVDILNSKDIGKLTEIRSVSLTMLQNYFITYIKTDKSEYFIPLSDMSFPYYDDDGIYRYSDLPVTFEKHNLYEFKDFFKEYRKYSEAHLKREMENEKDYMDKHGDDSVTYIDDNGESVTKPQKDYYATPSPTEAPEETDEPASTPNPTEKPKETEAPVSTPAVECSEWAKDDIQNAIANKILTKELQSGYTEDINRADFCRIAYNMLNVNGKADNIGSGVHFDDISIKEVYALSGMGIINGKGDNKFAPEDKITREEAAAILSRMIAFLNITDTQNTYSFYADGEEISDWAREDVYKVQKYEIMQGVDGGNFAPKEGYTKEQAVTTIMRVMSKIK